MNSRKRPLYELPFGNEGAVVYTDILKFSDNIAKVVSSLNFYESTLPKQEFASKSRVLSIDGLKISASANTPVIVDVGHTDDVTLMIPMQGMSSSTFDNKRLVWGEGVGACFLPSMKRGGDSTYRSLLTLTINEIKLRSTMRAMYGLFDDEKLNANLSAPKVVPLTLGHMNLVNAFHGLSKIIDAANLDAELLQMQGVDDMFYRNIAIMLEPEIFIKRYEKRPQLSKNGFKNACDYALAHLSDRITLTKLENVSGLSQRALHNAFVDKFQKSPMQWVKEQRLNAAHKSLNASNQSDTVTQIALGLGFSNLGQFSIDYRKKFGESPSAALSKQKH